MCWSEWDLFGLNWNLVESPGSESVLDSQLLEFVGMVDCFSLSSEAIEIFYRWWIFFSGSCRRSTRSGIVECGQC